MIMPNNLGRQYSLHADEYREKAISVLDSGWYILGKEVEAFENEWAEYIGTKYCVGLASGLDALWISFRLLGIHEGDEVIVCANAYIACVMGITINGATPVFVEPDKYNNIDAEKIEEVITSRTKAILAVHLFGQACDMSKIMNIAQKYNLKVVEDCAQSHGNKWLGQTVGTFGDIGIYSFNGNKIITTSGGGALVSNNDEYVKKARFLSTQAKEAMPYYEHKGIGYNYRMSNVVAGIGRGQLRVLDRRVKEKNHIFETYKEAFKEIDDIKMMPITEGCTSNQWLSVITLKEESKVKPTDIIEALEKENIESRRIWKPMNLQPIYKDNVFYSHNESGISVGEDIFNLSLIHIS